MKNNMSLRLSLASALFVAGVSAYAAELSPEDALARVVGKNVYPLSSVADKSQYKLVFTQDIPSTDRAGVYVFSRGNSFIAVSADDRAEALLAYSDRPFNPEDMPESLIWWLSEYAREIEALPQEYIVTTAESTADTKAPIEPMVKTLWNQSEPYNNKCPLVNGKRAVTGCVATALAQIMNYHRYPAVGQGSITNSTNGTTLDFSTVSFDWDNMADSYSESSTIEQEDAVATLMYAAGMAVDMRYSSSESGAKSDVIAEAMYKYFNYDKSIFTAYRDYYGIKDWNDFVYNQLVEYGPVQYSGTNSQGGGHSFVCDGYSSDGYFHINWGWGGVSDGYYKLSALDPDVQGIGGSALGYNYSQSVVANVSKPRENSTLTPVIYMTSGLAITPLTGIATGGVVTVSSQYANYSFTTVTGAPGLKVSDESGNVYYSKTNGLVSSLAPFEAASQVRMLTPVLEDGTYTVTPAYYVAEEDRWYDVRVLVGNVLRYTLKVTNGYMRFTPAEAGKLVIADTEILTPLYFSEVFKAKATLSNVGGEEYVGNIQPVLFNSSNKLVASGEYVNIDLLAGESQDFTYIGSFTQSSTRADGTYKFAFIDATTSDILSDPIEVVVKSTPGNTSVRMTDMKLVGDAACANADNLIFEGTLNCSQGYYGGEISLYLGDMGGNIIDVIPADEKAYFIGSGESAAFRAQGKFRSAVAGTQYIAVAGFINGNSFVQVSNIVPFTIGVSGIESVEATEGEVEYFNLQGMPVENPGKGIYLRRQGKSTSKVIIR